MDALSTEVALMQYVLWFGVTLVFSLLTVLRWRSWDAVCWSVISTVSWFCMSLGQLALSPVDSPLQSAAAYYYLGLGMIFMCFTMVHAIKLFQVSQAKKWSVDPLEGNEY